MTRSRSERSRFSKTASKMALRGKHPAGRHDQRTGPSSRAKRRVQGRETTPYRSGRPLATERAILPFRRIGPRSGTQPRTVAARAAAARRIVASSRRQGRAR